MWGDLIGCRPQVNLLVDIEAGDDEEDPGPPGSSCQKTTQPEDDGSLVLLDHLDSVEEGEGERGDDEKEGDDSHEVTAEAGSLLAG